MPTLQKRPVTIMERSCKYNRMHPKRSCILKILRTHTVGALDSKNPSRISFQSIWQSCLRSYTKAGMQKLDSRSLECTFLGYSTVSKAYQLWSYEKENVIVSRDVIFKEDSPLVHKSKNQDYVSIDTLFLAECEDTLPIQSSDVVEHSSSESLIHVDEELLHFSHSDQYSTSGSSINHNHGEVSSSASTSGSLVFLDDPKLTTGNCLSENENSTIVSSSEIVCCSSSPIRCESNNDSQNNVLRVQSVIDIYKDTHPVNLTNS